MSKPRHGVPLDELSKVVRLFIMPGVPDYLFTLHAYGTWMPDRAEGSVHWKRGYQPQSLPLADAYRSRQHDPSARFDERAQRVIIEALHFDYLCDEYLPTHRVLRWDARRGWC